MELIDDALCRRMLEVLGSKYPGWGSIDDLRDLADGHVLGINARYMQAEGLVQAQWRNTGERGRPFGPIKITDAGVTFLRGRGLADQEQVVTVRLHDDTLKALLELVIQQAPAETIAPSQKDRLKEAVRELPADATKSLLLRLTDLAWANAPAALELLRRTLP